MAGRAQNPARTVDCFLFLFPFSVLRILNSIALFPLMKKNWHVTYDPPLRGIKGTTYTSRVSLSFPSALDCRHSKPGYLKFTLDLKIAIQNPHA